jgi:hypothetical protein
MALKKSMSERSSRMVSVGRDGAPLRVELFFEYDPAIFSGSDADVLLEISTDPSRA